MPTRTEKQKELAKKWQQQKDPDALNNLIESVDPLIDSKASEFTPPSLKKETVKNKMKNQIIKDLDDYDPDQSAFHTWAVNFPIRKTPRYVNKIQNTAYIPEARKQKISSYDNAKEKLKNKMGREPSSSELADELGWGVKEVELIEKSQRDEIQSSSVDQIGDFDVAPSSKTEDVMHLMKYELDGEEEYVFENLIGYGEEDKQKTGKEIANDLGVSQAKISKIKKRIENKMEDYL